MRSFYHIFFILLFALSFITQAKVCSGSGDLRSEANETLNTLIKEKAELEILLEQSDVEKLKLLTGTLSITALKLADLFSNIALSKANPAAKLLIDQVKVVSNTIIHGEKAWDTSLEQVNNIKAIAAGDSYLINKNLNLAYGIFLTGYDIHNIGNESLDTAWAADAAKVSANRVLQKLDVQIEELNASLHELPDC